MQEGSKYGIVSRMRPPLFVRELSPEELTGVQAGLRSASSFTLRRCQIILASRQGRNAREIGAQLGCSDQTVRTAIKAFTTHGLAALSERSHAPQRTPHAVAVDSAVRAALKDLLHRSPREFGKATSVWSLPLVAAVAYAEGILARPVSGETIRRALGEIGVSWQRAKRWLVSPDPAYARKKNAATG